MNQAEWEQELLAYASKLQPQHLQQLAQIHAQSGPAGVIQALSQTGLSRGAVEVAAATIEGAGFDGAVRATQGRLQEIAHSNLQAQASQWLNTNRISADPNAESPAQQVLALHEAAKQNGTTPVEVARQNGLVYDAAEAAAQAERLKHGDGERTRMQGLLGTADWHRAAAAAGVTPEALLKQVKSLLETEGDFEAIQKLAPGMFKDERAARDVLGIFSDLEQTDRLVARQSEKDGPAPPKKPGTSDGWRPALSESLDRVQEQNARTQRPTRPVVKATEEDPGADHWRTHLAESWDRNGGGSEAAPSYSESEPSAAEAEAA